MEPNHDRRIEYIVTEVRRLLELSDKHSFCASWPTVDGPPDADGNATCTPGKSFSVLITGETK